MPAPIVRFVEGTEHRAAELRRIVPSLQLELTALPVGFACAEPDPAHRARDMVMALGWSAGDRPAVAEAVDLTTVDGQSLRLELDSENEARFCRYRRETPAVMQLCVALRRGDGEVELFAAECEGRIADQPAGPRGAGWDRLFVPDGFTATMAELSAAGSRGGDPDPVGIHALVYGDLAAALGL